MSLELPPLVRSGVFFLFFLGLSGGLSRSFFAAISPHFPRWEILDYMAYCLIIRDFFMVLE